MDHALDLGAVRRGLDRIQSWSSVKNSIYYDEYEDHFNDMAIRSAGLYNDLERIIDRFSLELPVRSMRHWSSDDTNSAVYWFDSAVLMLPYTDMDSLLEFEAEYIQSPEDVRKKRINDISRLSKQENQLLTVDTFRFIFRYRKLACEYEGLIGLISELDRMHAAAKSKEAAIRPHQAEWL